MRWALACLRVQRRRDWATAARPRHAPVGASFTNPVAGHGTRGAWPIGSFMRLPRERDDLRRPIATCTPRFTTQNSSREWPFPWHSMTFENTGFVQNNEDRIWGPLLHTIMNIQLQPFATRPVVRAIAIATWHVNESVEPAKVRWNSSAFVLPRVYF